MADEFATALLIMVGHKERVRAATEFLAANPSTAEALAKVFRKAYDTPSRVEALVSCAINPTPELQGHAAFGSCTCQSFPCSSTVAD